MKDTFPCGDREALVAYLYDESAPEERAAIAAHVTRCLSCAEEIEGLRATRTLLAGWTPPEAVLGFQVTRADERAAPVVLRPPVWWRQPLPAWAQAAAAALIFAAGMAAGTARASDPAPQAAAAVPAALAPAAAPAAAPVIPVVSRDDFARLEERLGAIEASQARIASPASAPARADEDALIRRVLAIVQASEERQRRENVTMIADVIRDFDLQREYDRLRMEEKLVEIQDSTGAAFYSLVSGSPMRPARR